MMNLNTTGAIAALLLLFTSPVDRGSQNKSTHEQCSEIAGRSGRPAGKQGTSATAGMPKSTDDQSVDMPGACPASFGDRLPGYPRIQKYSRAHERYELLTSLESAQRAR